MLRWWSLLVLLLAGCSFWQSGDLRGPAGVDPDVRLALLLSVVGEQGTMLLLFGGPAHDVFLGCLSCERTERESIFDDAGRYGSLNDPNSIWNPQGRYGDKASPLSPWNPHPSAPPIVKDEFEHFYGYFTVDAAWPGRVRIPAIVRFLKLQSLQ